jgi:hypothetical protein
MGVGEAEENTIGSCGGYYYHTETPPNCLGVMGRLTDRAYACPFPLQPIPRSSEELSNRMMLHDVVADDVVAP